MSLTRAWKWPPWVYKIWKLDYMSQRQQVKHLKDAQNTTTYKKQHTRACGSVFQDKNALNSFCSVRHFFKHNTPERQPVPKTTLLKGNMPNSFIKILLNQVGYFSLSDWLYEYLLFDNLNLRKLLLFELKCDVSRWF